MWCSRQSLGRSRTFLGLSRHTSSIFSGSQGEERAQGACFGFANMSIDPEFVELTADRVLETNLIKSYLSLSGGSRSFGDFKSYILYLS